MKYIILFLILGFVLYKIGRFFWRAYLIYSALKKAIKENIHSTGEDFVKFGQFDIKNRPKASDKKHPQSGEYIDFEEVK
ncbi:MAG: hypothetical protein MUE85_05885 [Microscillaceae bacterium]|nr:hypothetical protein [Microscillaceae bacterium]